MTCMRRCLVFFLLVILVLNPLACAGADTIAINPVGDHAAGDIFIINGTTTLPAGRTLVIDIDPIRLHPHPLQEPSQNTTALTGWTTTQYNPDGHTVWIFTVDSTSLIADTYVIRVTSLDSPVVESSVDITLHPRNGTHPIETPAPGEPASPSPPPPQKSDDCAGLTATLPVAALGILAALGLLRKGNPP